MADIKQIKLPNNITYDIVDQGARDLISALDGHTAWLGVTTTALSEGSTTNPIVINGDNVTAVNGDVTSYNNKEFIFNGSAWQEFGDLSGLGDLAFKNSVTGSFTPVGNVSRPTFTGDSMTSSGTYKPEGSVNISKASSGATNFTPEGTVSVIPNVTLDTASVTPMGSVGTLPSCTLPAFTASVNNEILTIGWSSGSFSAGSLPTKGADVTVATGVDSATATATFTGTAVRLEGTFSGTSKTVSVNGTPTGTISTPTFTGTAGTVTSD